jgi:hypothetical protein
MSTIHSTLEKVPYTVVGQRANIRRKEDAPAVILLNLSSRLVRRDYLAELVHQGFSEIISVEAQENSFSVEALSQEFPSVRFLLLPEVANTGLNIDIAATLIAADTFLVMWSSMDVPTDIARAGEYLRETKRVCVAPGLRSDHGEQLPVVQTPAMQRRTLRVLSLPVRGQSVTTLFPFDFVGLYHRERFLSMRGFDTEINHRYWQLLDLGFRVAMWNREILVVPGFRMSYRTMPEPEDQTPTPGYARFYARNLAVRFKNGVPIVSRWQALPFATRARLGLRETIRTFSEASEWVHEQEQHVQRDARQVIQEWQVAN